MFNVFDVVVNYIVYDVDIVNVSDVFDVLMF